MDGDAPKPIQVALDLFVFAPLGFLFEARTLVPELVAKGRQHVANARVVGRFAVDKGQAIVSQRVEARRAGAPAPGPGEPAGPAPVLGFAPVDADVEVDIPLRFEQPTATAGPTVPEPGALAIPDYDSLAASQVVPRLDALSRAELEAVRAYEASHRGRRTILARVRQLADPAGPDHDPTA